MIETPNTGFLASRPIYHLQCSKTCLKRPLKKKTKNLFSIPIIAKCRSKVLQNATTEHSAILLTFIKLLFAFKIFVLSIFEWPLKTGFTVPNSGDSDKMVLNVTSHHCLHCLLRSKHIFSN